MPIQNAVRRSLMVLNPWRPRVSPTSESGTEFREPQRKQQSKRCEPAARL